MKKFKAFLFLLFTVAGVIAFWQLDMKVMKLQGEDLAKQEVIKNEVDEAKSRLDDAAVIRKAFKAVGVLGVFEGREQYKQLIEDENWYSYRSINIDWQYRFAIAANLGDFDIKVDNGVVNISIDKSKLFIWFLEKTEESDSSSYSSILARRYNSRDIEVLEKAVAQKVEETIKDTENYWSEAQKSLESNMIKLCNELGFYTIYFTLK